LRNHEFRTFLFSNSNNEVSFEGIELNTQPQERELTMENIGFIPLLGRVLIGLPFLMSGLGKIPAYGPTTAYIASVGLPLPPLGWAIAVAFEVGGGLLLLLGFRAREVASGLALFTLAAAICFHANFVDQNQTIHFLKDLMIAGGLLQIAYFGAGRYSLDVRISRDPKFADASA
jgi:putative oxidoreductase